MLHHGDPHELITETYMWQPLVDGLKRDVPIDVVRHPDAFSQPEQVHAYLGMGEELPANRRGVRIMGERGLAGVGFILPFHILPLSSANLERTIIEAPQAIAQDYNVLADKPADTPVDLLGHSQGGGVVLISAINRPEQFGAVAAWSPIGLNHDSFTGTDAERRHQFLWRLGVRNNFKADQNMFRDPRNLRAGKQVGGRALKDALARRLNTKLDTALGFNLAPGTRKLARDHNVAVFAADDDPLFPYSAIYANLGDAADEVMHKIPGSHSNVASRAGAARLTTVADWMRDVRTRRHA